MGILEVLLLGIVQGLTEFIPVSSSGHLVLFQEILGVEQAGLLFDVSLHFGTLVALFLYFWKDIKTIVQGFFAGKQTEKNLVFLLAIATVPGVIAGLLLEEAAATTFRSPQLVMITLGLFGLVMLLAERYAKQLTQNDVNKVSLRQALIIGVAQALAIVPGVSRSGVTISAGLFAGLNRVAAARFSFLLAMPTILGATIKVLLSDGALAAIGEQSLQFGLGFLTAFASGLLAIKFLLAFLTNHSLAAFAYYRFVIAAVILITLSLT